MIFHDSVLKENAGDRSTGFSREGKSETKLKMSKVSSMNSVVSPDNIDDIESVESPYQGNKFMKKWTAQRVK